MLDIFTLCISVIDNYVSCWPARYMALQFNNVMTECRQFLWHIYRLAERSASHFAAVEEFSQKVITVHFRKL